MSEKEIIEVLEKLIKKYDEPCGMHINPIELWQDERDAIENLMDLYKKQKEKIKELETMAKFCKVDNLPKDVEGIFMYKEDFDRNFRNDYISKYKIKAKIEELLNSYMKVVKIEDTIMAMIHNEKIDNQIKILQELLED